MEWAAHKPPFSFRLFFGTAWTYKIINEKSGVKSPSTKLAEFQTKLVGIKNAGHIIRRSVCGACENKKRRVALSRPAAIACRAV